MVNDIRRWVGMCESVSKPFIFIIIEFARKKNPKAIAAIQNEWSSVCSCQTIFKWILCSWNPCFIGHWLDWMAGKNSQFLLIKTQQSRTIKWKWLENNEHKNRIQQVISHKPCLLALAYFCSFCFDKFLFVALITLWTGKAKGNSCEKMTEFKTWQANLIVCWLEQWYDEQQ